MAHHGHDPSTTAEHGHDTKAGLNGMAASATLHCLTGCAIGEILGLLIGTAAGLSTGLTIALAVGLAFVFGFALSTLPLLNAGLGLGAALGVVVAADTLSIATMELVDNAVMAAIPGAMDAGLVNPVFWLAMSLSLVVAYAVAFPVNRYLLARGKGHALTHAYHGADRAGRWPALAGARQRRAGRCRRHLHARRPRGLRRRCPRGRGSVAVPARRRRARRPGPERGGTAPGAGRPEAVPSPTVGGPQPGEPLVDRLWHGPRDGQLLACPR